MSPWFQRRASSVLALALLLGAVGSVRAAPAPAGKSTLPELAARLSQIRGLVHSADDNLKLVENGYTQRAEVTPTEAHERRFSDGEIQYLLGDYAHASVLFYDLVSDATFSAQSPRYADALNYLADSLYQQGNLLGARLYLRQLLALPLERNGNHEREALARYLEVAGRLNEFAGIDPLIEQAEHNAGGKLPPELTYVLGKWLFKRTDLSDGDRWARTQKTFEALTAADSRYRWQASYFLGVVLVQKGDLAKAAEKFKSVGEAAKDNGPTPEVRELAQISLGRVLFEMGRYYEAVDHYQEIPRESSRFPEALYETAWAYVKLGQFELARNSADLVLLVAPDSTLAPDAQLLLAHLQLKLKRYREADQAYNGVINQYGPVRDEVDALLTVHRDPIAYFDKLLQRRDRDLDVQHLLPAVALKWATTQQEVAEAVRMVGDLDSGEQSMKEARDVADRILQALNTRALEAFPTVQEGYVRVNAVASTLTQVEQELVRTEGQLSGDLLNPGKKLLLEDVRKQARVLEAQFARMPHTPEEMEARRAKLRERVTAIDKEAFHLTTEIQSLNAIVAALGKWLNDTRTERNSAPEDEKAFATKVKNESRELTWLNDEVTRLRGSLSEEKGQADVFVGGEEAIRREYAELLQQEREIMESVLPEMSGESASLMRDAIAIRAQKENLVPRVEAAKGILTDQLRRRGQEIRDKVVAEQKLLAQYSQESDAISVDARQLVGQIAFGSFKRVRQQFYDLVLKADVGLVDVAFTRKQDKTAEIQRLSGEKDKAIKSLDDEFKTVLQEAD